MENRMNRVLRACVELGDRNPIVSIHDQVNQMRHTNRYSCYIMQENRVCDFKPQHVLNLLHYWFAYKCTSLTFHEGDSVGPLNSDLQASNSSDFLTCTVRRVRVATATC